MFAEQLVNLLSELRIDPAKPAIRKVVGHISSPARLDDLPRLPRAFDLFTKSARKRRSRATFHWLSAQIAFP